ncbi:methyltransferase-like protein 25B [Epargyreus clarus]|uniref:methyltransferase-like protein 25B n=1 Tax=Epargyreus clarus TaxID=520877 RepID=UPI003C2F683E
MSYSTSKMDLQKDAVRKIISMSLKVIRMYDWLLDLYVLDFFVDNHWSKLPSIWRKCFEKMDPEDLGKILSGHPTRHMLPLSFLALIKFVKALEIPRIPCKIGSDLRDEKDETLNSDSCGSHPKLKNLFLKHVKLKKRHEISLMADVVHSTALRSDCTAVVDFGSGLGHLVRVLAYKHDLYAAGLECQTQLTEEARKLDLELEYTVKKHLSEESVRKLKRPSHLDIRLSSEAQLQKLCLPDNMDSYGLIGLHPCGDLGPLLLKHFITCNKVKFICVVGCCFMKLTCDCEPCGYPLSKYVKGLDSGLSYVSREIACHAIEVYCERLMKGDYKNLKIHAYRAALERILIDRSSKLKHSPIRSIKHTDTMTFESYCQAALERLGLQATPEECAYGRAALSRWAHVVVVYTLRLAIAPLVETVILLDRILYVLENGLWCEIYPVFDPKLSPRNHIIIGRRV